MYYIYILSVQTAHNIIYFVLLLLLPEQKAFISHLFLMLSVAFDCLLELLQIAFPTASIMKQAAFRLFDGILLFCLLQFCAIPCQIRIVVVSTSPAASINFFVLYFPPFWLFSRKSPTFNKLYINNLTCFRFINTKTFFVFLQLSFSISGLKF